MNVILLNEFGTSKIKKEAVPEPKVKAAFSQPSLVWEGRPVRDCLVNDQKSRSWLVGCAQRVVQMVFFFIFFLYLHEGNKAGKRQVARSTTGAWSGPGGTAVETIFGFLVCSGKKRERKKRRATPQPPFPKWIPNTARLPKTGNERHSNLNSIWICHIKAS